jgi:hypothetical protein
MSYKDLEEARAKRATKGKATTIKGKRGRKRKSSTIEAEVDANSQETAPSVKAARTSRVLEPAPQRAPVARMY